MEDLFDLNDFEDKPEITPDAPTPIAANGIKDKEILTKEEPKIEEKKARRVIRELFYHYCEMLKPVCDESKIERAVTDYISGMTDRFAVEKYKENFIPIGLQCGAKEDYLFKLAKVIEK